MAEKRVSRPRTSPKPASKAPAKPTAKAKPTPKPSPKARPAAEPAPADQQERLRQLNELLRGEREQAGKRREKERRRPV